MSHHLLDRQRWVENGQLTQQQNRRTPPYAPHSIEDLVLLEKISIAPDHLHRRSFDATDSLLNLLNVRFHVVEHRPTHTAAASGMRAVLLVHTSLHQLADPPPVLTQLEHCLAGCLPFHE